MSTMDEIAEEEALISKIPSEPQGRLLYQVALEQSNLSYFQLHVGRHVKHAWSHLAGVLGGFWSLSSRVVDSIGNMGTHLKYEASDFANGVARLPGATVNKLKTGDFMKPFRNFIQFYHFASAIKKEFSQEWKHTLRFTRKHLLDFSLWSRGTKIYVGYITLLSIFTLYHYVLRPWPKHKVKHEVNCLHKTVVITGSSSGIGYRLAYEFLQRGAFVILTSPDMVKARKARLDLSRKLMIRLELEKRLFMDDAQVRYYDQVELPYTLDIDFLLQNMCELELNLASTASIYSFARKVQGMFPNGIDILINNAAANASPEEMVVTDEGKEIHFAVNYFGHFVLTNLLMGLLVKRNGARIINVTCKKAVEQGCIDINEFIGPYLEEEGLPFLPAKDGYANSKLAMYLFSRQLSKELAFSRVQNVTTYCVCPGTALTFIDRRCSFSSRLSQSCYNITRKFYKTPFYAVQPILYCALSQSCAQESGFFYENNEKSFVHTRHSDPDKVATTLWSESLKLMSVGHISMLKLTEQMHVISHENIFQLAKDLFLHRRDVMTHLLLTEETQAFETRHKMHTDIESSNKDVRKDFIYFWNGFYLTGGENSGLIERWVLYNAHPGFRALQQEYDIWFECTGSSHFHPESSGKLASIQYMPSMAAPMSQEEINVLEGIYESDSEPDEDVEYKDRYYRDYIPLDEFV